MKKYLSFFIVLTMALAINVQSLRAEDGQGWNSSGKERLNTSTEVEREHVRGEMLLKIQGLREEAKHKMEELRGEIKGEKDSLKAKMEELRITGREKALERFDNAVERISKLQDRINSKIDELQAKGVNTTDAENLTATSETKLTDAKNKIAEINALLATSTNELTAENRTTLRTLAQDTQALIIEAHKALRDAVKSLKDAVIINLKK